MILTVRPSSSSSANDLSVVCLMIDDSTNAEAHDGQWGDLLRCRGIGIGERVDIFGIGHSCLKFTPRYLRKDQ